jgi:hypothetical protein
MEEQDPEKPFERYADDIIVHSKTGRQVRFVLGGIRYWMCSCGLTLHPEKTHIVNLRGQHKQRY